MNAGAVIKSLRSLIPRRRRPSKSSTLEKALGYRFKDATLLATALTHPSFAFDKTDCESYQRLEFLGDAVLDLILAQSLYAAFPKEAEGFLAQARSALVRGRFLSQVARKLGIGAHIRMSPHELETSGNTRPAVLEDALEALIGAIYLDSNFKTASSVVLNWYGDLEEQAEQALEDENPKGRLQERIHAANPGVAIEYNVIEATGPDHARVFTVEIVLEGKRLGRGTGRSKKKAEEAAASVALQELDK